MIAGIQPKPTPIYISCVVLCHLLSFLELSASDFRILRKSKRTGLPMKGKTSLKASKVSEDKQPSKPNRNMNIYVPDSRLRGKPIRGCHRNLLHFGIAKIAYGFSQQS